MSDSDHSNVIWMLLADLSTVFGDKVSIITVLMNDLLILSLKIDPRTAVQTWYDLPEDETANMVQ